MNKLFTHPLFSIGLVVRLVLIFTILPVAVTEWFVPFLDRTTSILTIDPWTYWLEHHGSPLAFPYGYVMWLMFLPLTLLCKLIGLPLHLGYALTLLIADIGLLKVLSKLLPNKERFLLAVYWLSPIVLIASYVLGHNDLIPVILLMLSLYYIRKLSLFVAGVFGVMAISAKLSMVLVLPFYAIYLMHARAVHRLVPELIKGTLLATLIFGLPFLSSDMALQMLLSNPEMGKVYQFAFPIGQDIYVYIVPLVYLFMLYGAWRVHRMNFALFQSMLGIAFLLVVLLTPASPGWFIWAVPFLVSYQAMNGSVAIVLSTVFSILYLLGTLLTLPSIPFGFDSADLVIIEFTSRLEPHVASLLHTLMLAIGAVLALRIWRESVNRNDYFRFSRKPFAIGIAGDSASGKDTLADALQGLFGGHSVVHLSGDDYHLWDRKKPIWQVMTHLNPKANDLEGYANDLISLLDGKPILQRHYDHKSGVRSKEKYVKSNDFIIASGLHSLYLPILRRCFALSVYLDIDEELRRYLKIKRDVGQRGYEENDVHESLHKREADSIQFIRPQANYADLVLSLQPIHARMLNKVNEQQKLRFKLLVKSRNGLNEVSLTRVLVGVCGLHVDMTALNDANEVELTIEGETSAEDVAMAARSLCSRTLEFLDIEPQWADGVLGLMQLITLSHINQALTKRIL